MVTTRSGKNTSGLQLFNHARDVALQKNGIAGFPGLTAATHVEYDKSIHPKTFGGWRSARHVVLANNGFPKGYPGLMTAAKREHALIKASMAGIRSHPIGPGTRSAQAYMASVRAARTPRAQRACTPSRTGAPRVRTADGKCRVRK